MLIHKIDFVKQLNHEVFWSFDNYRKKYQQQKKILTKVSFPKQALVFTGLQYKSFENNVGKGEIAHNKQFLLFPPCFRPTWRLSAIFIKI